MFDLIVVVPVAPPLLQVAERQGVKANKLLVKQSALHTLVRNVVNFANG